MNYQEYLNNKKEIYDIFIQYIDDEEDDEYGYQQLINVIEKQKIMESKDEITLFLRLLISISNHHHRHHCFFNRIEKILLFFIPFIKNAFTCLELFKICKSNKLIVLFLIKLEVIVVNKIIVEKMIYRSQKTNTKYHQFFYPEIKKCLSNKQLKAIEQEINIENMDDFENKRNIGENENYLCELIRNDSIEEFIVFINRSNIPISQTIKPSIFETNNFLMKNEPTLIEYAAFYGSIQIFQYLKFNDAEMDSLLWYYVIHSKTAEMIHLLEESQIEPPDNEYNNCLCESIKCHHNDIANYFVDMFLNEGIINYKQIFQYYNIMHLPLEQNDNMVFYYLCRYDYKIFVELYIKPKKDILKERIKSVQI